MSGLDGTILPPENVKRLSQVLVDDYVMKILTATYYRPKSAQELSVEHNIPIAVCYRKIKELVSLGLLKPEVRILTRKGKWVQLYRSQVKGAYVFIEKGRLRVRLELVSGRGEEIDNTVPILNREGQRT
ncbi:MAG: ArsR family transcriptional regulator [Thermoplasmata archaeon]|nr:ArsR family transcriptional regulator [Thermoplasmata archaeon]RLF70859.1 MAG: ArsR family transcriptional regulator [Thermoplasmata archaeon]RLF71927.1 MAG: ArsR family transcriptional regulator [Thermoplasmata archaeon]HDD60361.1 ArsR family transcriptional regulator [Euryarchaeota archaeon]